MSISGSNRRESPRKTRKTRKKTEGRGLKTDPIVLLLFFPCLPCIPWLRCFSDLLQQRDAAGRHPLDDEDVAVGVEAGVVRMDEAAGGPLLRLGADGRPLAQAADDLVAP